MAPKEEPRCLSCGMAYLAYRPGLPCPGCGRPSTESSDVVAESLRMYDENVRLYGRPIPPVIAVRSLRDDYLYRALFFLKALDERGPRESEERVVGRSLDALSAADPGWRDHLEGFYREVLRARRGRSERTK